MIGSGTQTNSPILLHFGDCSVLSHSPGDPGAFRGLIRIRVLPFLYHDKHVAENVSLARESRPLFSANALRMNRRNTVVTAEIPYVERENPIEPMDLHGGHKVGIMHLRTNDVVLNSRAPPPLTKGLHRIGQDQEHSFETAGISVGRSDAEAKTVHGRGTSTHIPELSHVLRCDTQDMSVRHGAS